MFGQHLRRFRRSSPSSRRAWIEIRLRSAPTRILRVALLAEGVDRNLDWESDLTADDVALLAEGVDRNFRLIDLENEIICRPPRGGRG